MSNFKTTVNLILIGAALGWMIGLSTSPVIGSVISAILTFIISILVVISGVDFKNENSNLKLSRIKVSFFPISIFCVTLAIVGSLGVYVRTHNFLGVNLPDNTKNSVLTRTEGKFEEKKESKFMPGVFFGAPEGTCDEIYGRLENTNSLKVYLKQLNLEKVNNFLRLNPDSLSLVIFSKGLCTRE